MGLAEQLEAAFKTSDLYKILNTNKSATATEIKSAYYKAALKLHPDRAPDEKKEQATAHFQLLGKAYAVLSDDERRKVYDECGGLEDEVAFSGGDMDRDWTEYWRAMFKKVTIEDVEDFAKAYRHSDEERNDIKQAYVDSEGVCITNGRRLPDNGDMDYIMDNIMCATIEDEPRFRKVLKGLIKKGEVPSYDTFVSEAKAKKQRRKRQAEQEAIEAEEAARELGLKRGKHLNDENDNLAALIHARQKQRMGAMEDMVAAMEAKYAPKRKSKGKGKAASNEPSEEEFQALQAKVDAGRKKNKEKS